eukprot:CAMPEP_0184659174 /NCGR_PEP_ID=MMETSP0308-20130426/28562_1 /TAXON_ID=38269 /ORGANISM="Gloeochaete witrockiana, Strain SAG 46.84" /LENGTH=593 /DNA_ID=CAMNT_0027098777 /DNA_START=169 /DNA_END=1950 /DNA_ORIENTATION=+
MAGRTGTGVGHLVMDGLNMEGQASPPSQSTHAHALPLSPSSRLLPSVSSILMSRMPRVDSLSRVGGKGSPLSVLPASGPIRATLIPSLSSASLRGPSFRAKLTPLVAPADPSPLRPAADADDEPPGSAADQAGDIFHVARSPSFGRPRSLSVQSSASSLSPSASVLSTPSAVTRPHTTSSIVEPSEVLGRISAGGPHAPRLSELPLSVQLSGALLSLAIDPLSSSPAAALAVSHDARGGLQSPSLRPRTFVDGFSGDVLLLHNNDPLAADQADLPPPSPQKRSAGVARGQTPSNSPKHERSGEKMMSPEQPNLAVAESTNNSSGEKPDHKQERGSTPSNSPRSKRGQNAPPSQPTITASELRRSFSKTGSRQQSMKKHRSEVKLEEAVDPATVPVPVAVLGSGSRAETPSNSPTRRRPRPMTPVARELPTQTFTSPTSMAPSFGALPAELFQMEALRSSFKKKGFVLNDDDTSLARPSPRRKAPSRMSSTKSRLRVPEDEAGSQSCDETILSHNTSRSLHLIPGGEEGCTDPGTQSDGEASLNRATSFSKRDAQQRAPRSPSPYPDNAIPYSSCSLRNRTPHNILDSVQETAS